MTSNKYAMWFITMSLIIGSVVAQSAQPDPNAAAAAPAQASSPLVFMVLLMKQLLNVAGYEVNTPLLYTLYGKSPGYPHSVQLPLGG